MLERKTEASWLGAEALPGDLDEINRINAARPNTAPRHQRPLNELRLEGLITTAMNWIKQRRPPSSW